MPSALGFLDSNDHTNCPAELAMEVMQGRWKVPILRELADGVQRFSQLRHSIAGISPKVLTSKLRELEIVGVVNRTIYAQVPPKVEYSLTVKGRALIPVLEGLHAWGRADFPSSTESKPAQEDYR